MGMIESRGRPGIKDEREKENSWKLDVEKGWTMLNGGGETEGDWMLHVYNLARNGVK